MIFYFTATGNCKRATEVLAEETGERLVSVADVLWDNEREFTVGPGEAVGFVMPTYFYSTPQPMLDYVSRLTLRGATYVYVVMTFGTVTGSAGRQFIAAAKRRGISVDAHFSIRTVDNYLPEYDIPEGEDLAHVLDSADEQARHIRKMVAERQRGNFNSRESWYGLALAPVNHRIYDHQRRTTNFHVGEGCVGCGLCSRVCPVSAVEMRHGRPVWWAERCACCFACLNRCPRQAIEYGRKTEGKARYVNPRTKLAKSGDASIDGLPGEEGDGPA